MKDDTPWPHAPTHRMAQQGTYFVTASTYLKAHHFRGASRLAVFHRGLLKMAASYGWQLEAWAVFSNHYHFVAHSPDDPSTLRPMLKTLHARLAGWVNRCDETPGRQVWYNFRDTLLTYERSYLARLSYTHQNPVRHGLVPVAKLYPWCSAGWLEENCPPATVKMIETFDTSEVNVADDFDVHDDW